MLKYAFFLDWKLEQLVSPIYVLLEFAKTSLVWVFYINKRKEMGDMLMPAIIGVVLGLAIGYVIAKILEKNT